MKLFLVSLAVGLVVGALYGALNVRSRVRQLSRRPHNTGETFMTDVHSAPQHFLGFAGGTA